MNFNGMPSHSLILNYIKTLCIPSSYQAIRSKASFLAVSMLQKAFGHEKDLKVVTLKVVQLFHVRPAWGAVSLPWVLLIPLQVNESLNDSETTSLHLLLLKVKYVAYAYQ